MRLFLASFMTGDCHDRLVSLAGVGTRAAIVLNAFDNFPDRRGGWLEVQQEMLTDLGFVPEELDLRKYFGAPEQLATELKRFGMLWINGGNSFLLRRAMRQSGFDAVAPALVRSNELVYAGFSAAAVCAAPTLRGIEFVDDPHSLVEGYDAEPIWEGLGFVDTCMVVHYKSRHPDAWRMEHALKYYQGNKIPYVTLHDSQVLVVDGDSTEVVG